METKSDKKNWMDMVKDKCNMKDSLFFPSIGKSRDGVRIRERLDRALATPEWISLFPLAKLYHLSSSVSDHAPLVLRMTPKPRSRRQKKLFRFESMWLKDQRCEQVVIDAWEKRAIFSRRTRSTELFRAM
uniref:Endonuclease/exonuclease/phosphatase n=1 Tax=Quercus lobata TaxID=97700 RepID=A0A7N2LWJ1_QUELO